MSIFDLKTNVGELASANQGTSRLDYEQQNAIEQFDVEFQYNFFTSATGASGGFGVNVSIDTPVGSIPL